MIRIYIDPKLDYDSQLELTEQLEPANNSLEKIKNIGEEQHKSSILDNDLRS